MNTELVTPLQRLSVHHTDSSLGGLIFKGNSEILVSKWSRGFPLSYYVIRPHLNIPKIRFWVFQDWLLDCCYVDLCTRYSNKVGIKMSLMHQESENILNSNHPKSDAMPDLVWCVKMCLSKLIYAQLGPTFLVRAHISYICFRPCPSSHALLACTHMCATRCAT